MATAQRGKQKDYVKIAQSKITKPSKMKPKWRFLIYSRHKKGKTTFCMSVNKMKGEKILILDAERGTDKYRKVDPDVWPITKWEDLQDAWGFLRTGKHDYTWVALDTMTKIHNMALRYIMRLGEDKNLDRIPGVVDQRDHGKAGELSKELVYKMDALPMGIIYTAQEKIDKGKDDEDELAESSVFYVPDMPPGVRGAVNSNVDVIGRLYVTKVDFKNPNGGDPITKNQRRLWINNHAMYDTGARSEYEVPDMLKNPTVEGLTSLLLEGRK